MKYKKDGNFIIKDEPGMNVIESVPFNQPHAFDLRFNHLIADNDERTFLHLIYKFGLDDAHYKEYEVLIPTYPVGQIVEMHD